MDTVSFIFSQTPPHSAISFMATSNRLARKVFCNGFRFGQTSKEKDLPSRAISLFKLSAVATAQRILLMYE